MHAYLVPYKKSNVKVPIKSCSCIETATPGTAIQKYKIFLRGEVSSLVWAVKACVSDIPWQNCGIEIQYIVHRIAAVNYK